MTAQRRTMSVVRGAAGHNWRRYIGGGLLWVAVWSLPAATGLVLQRVFNAISADAASISSVVAVLAVLAGVESARLVVFYAGISTWGRWWAGSQALMRTNLLRAQVVSGGPEAGPPAAEHGAAVATFRDDVEDLTILADCFVDLAGALLFGLFAVVVMVQVDVLLTLVVVLPLIAVYGVNVALADRIRRVRREDREATAQVTGYLGDVFSAVLAVKVAGAEGSAVGRLARLNRARLRTSVRDKVLTDSMDAFNGSTVDLTIGLVLLLVASQMRAGSFTVGDLALFSAYVASLAGVPRMAGVVLARHRHAQVAVGRMAALLPGDDEREAVRPRALRLDRAHPPAVRARPARPAHVRVCDFSVAYGEEEVVSGVDLELRPGSFTVVTGRVGAGKTTLLRGLLGLEPGATGIVEWNSALIGDLAAHMVPPRCAHVPQVPRLFSATLLDNLTLGVQTTDAEVARALHLAALEGDVADMAEGLLTPVGPRGVRLSGGQLQRAAAARALAADTAMLVLDDLSSALDADTEQRLWHRLRKERAAAAAPRTVLVVSHRAAALAQADQVVHMEAGRVVAVGTPDELRDLDLLGLTPA
jgi:ATP-binding cassette subfamily B protein